MHLMWNDPTRVNSEVKKLVIPPSLHACVLNYHHNTIFTPHLGVKKTVDRVRQRFFWPGLWEAIRQHIRFCQVCATSKGAYRKFQAALVDFCVGISMDRLPVMGPLPGSLRENKYILMVVDDYTRWMEAFPLPDQKSRIVAHKMSATSSAVSAPHWNSTQTKVVLSKVTFFQEVCRLLAVTKTRSTPYHPSANRLFEWFNHTLGNMIQSYPGGDCEDWDLYIPMLTAAYRATSHPATGLTLNFLMLGRETMTPTDIEFPWECDESVGIPEYVASLQTQLANAMALSVRS